jgi:hypothetical protein
LVFFIDQKVQSPTIRVRPLFPSWPTAELALRRYAKICHHMKNKTQMFNPWDFDSLP